MGFEGFTRLEDGISLVQNEAKLDEVETKVILKSRLNLPLKGNGY